MDEPEQKTGKSIPASRLQKWLRDGGEGRAYVWQAYGDSVYSSMLPAACSSGSSQGRSSTFVFPIHHWNFFQLAPPPLSLSAVHHSQHPVAGRSTADLYILLSPIYCLLCPGWMPAGGQETILALEHSVPIHSLHTIRDLMHVKYFSSIVFYQDRQSSPTSAFHDQTRFSVFGHPCTPH